MLADAIGLRPFKDTFWTTTNQPGNKYSRWCLAVNKWVESSAENKLENSISKDNTLQSNNKDLWEQS